MKPTEEKIHSSPSDLPVYLFKQGNNCEAYRYFGAHIEQRAGETGVVFRVWVHPGHERIRRVQILRHHPRGGPGL